MDQRKSLLILKISQNKSQNWDLFFFFLSYWEVRLFHLRVYQVIFKTCLVFLQLFYFNKQEGTWQPLALTFTLSILAVARSTLWPSTEMQNGTRIHKPECGESFENTARGEFSTSRHKHGSQTSKLDGTGTKNCVSSIILNNHPFCKLAQQQPERRVLVSRKSKPKSSITSRQGLTHLSSLTCKFNQCLRASQTTRFWVSTEDRETKMGLCPQEAATYGWRQRQLPPRVISVFREVRTGRMEEGRLNAAG